MNKLMDMDAPSDEDNGKHLCASDEENDDDISVEEWYEQSRKRASAFPPSGVEHCLGKTYRRMKDLYVMEMSMEMMKTIDFLDCGGVTSPSAAIPMEPLCLPKTARSDVPPTREW